MKIFFTIILVCATILITGGIHWKQQTAITSFSTKVNEKTESSQVESQSESQATAPLNEDIQTLASNWPKAAQTLLVEKIKNKQIFHIAFVGSQDLNKDENGWSAQLKERLLAAYGEDHIDVKILEYDDLTSLHFYEDDKISEVVAAKPDLLLFEPFTLNDNGKVTIEDNHDIISKTVQAVTDENEQASFILQPSHPIFGAQIYPEQVGKLKDFAKEQEIMYLNHWKAWPNSNDEKLNDYLNADQSAPNEKGSRLWADYLAETLISQS
jgi:hypothetical protein